MIVITVPSHHPEFQFLRLLHRYSLTLAANDLTSSTPSTVLNENNSPPPPTPTSPLPNPIWWCPPSQRH